MKAYSLALRQKILRAYEQRLGSPRAIAALFGGSQSFVDKLLRRRRMAGDLAPRPHAGGRPALCDSQALTCVRRLVHEQCEATLEELGERLHRERGVRVSVPTMSRIGTHLALPRKKSRFTPVNGTPSGSNRRGRLIKRRSPPSPPSASNSSMNRASTSR